MDKEENALGNDQRKEVKAKTKGKMVPQDKEIWSPESEAENERLGEA